jgi:DnaD/phage-associated family protein|nr:MAG TPA: Replication initiation and membrane attachment [Caudoviricetes sp.]
MAQGRLKINYIAEINAFHAWLQVNELSASAILLWYSLMHFCNKTGWRSEFNLALSQLESDTHLSRATIKRARFELESAGLIKVHYRRGRQSSVYEIQPISIKLAAHIEPQSEPQNKLAAHIEPQSEPIPRHRLISIDVDSKAAAAEKIIANYQDKIHPLTSTTELEIVEDLMNDYGPELFDKAIDRAVLRGKRTIKYIAGILKRWNQDGYDEPDGSMPRDVPDEVKAIPF